jgi:hypothetical protein
MLMAVRHKFQSGANEWVNAIAVQSGSKILIGGYFTTLGGEQARPHELAVSMPMASRHKFQSGG